MTSFFPSFLVLRRYVCNSHTQFKIGLGYASAVHTYTHTHTELLTLPEDNRRQKSVSVHIIFALGLSSQINDATSISSNS